MGANASSSNQYSNQSGTYSGSQAGANYGVQNSSSTSSVNPNVPAQNQAYYDQAGANLGPNGLSAIQNQVLNSAPQPGIGSTAVQTSINDLNALQPGYANLASQSYTPYTVATAATPDQVTASPGASFMGAYASPYLQDVVNSSLASYDNNAANALNQMHAARDAGSAFGDRSALQDATYRANSDLGRGQLASNLLNTGFNTAAGFGQQDASRALQAAQGNQTTAANINMFNAGQSNQAAQNNAQDNLQQQGLDLNALNSAGQNAVNSSQLAQQGVRLNSDLANNLFNYGGQGQGQLLNLFTAGNPLIGQTSTNNTSSENLGLSANEAAGQSQSSSTGGGSSKGGSINPLDDIKKLSLL